MTKRFAKNFSYEDIKDLLESKGLMSNSKKNNLKIYASFKTCLQAAKKAAFVVSSSKVVNPWGSTGEFFKATFEVNKKTQRAIKDFAKAIQKTALRKNTNDGLVRMCAFYLSEYCLDSKTYSRGDDFYKTISNCLRII